MSWIETAKKTIDPDIWEKLPQEARIILGKNGFISVPMKTISISELYGEGDILNDIVVESL